MDVYYLFSYMLKISSYEVEGCDWKFNLTAICAVIQHVFLKSSKLCLGCSIRSIIVASLHVLRKESPGFCCFISCLFSVDANYSVLEYAKIRSWAESSQDGSAFCLFTRLVWFKLGLQYSYSIWTGSLADLRTVRLLEEPWQLQCGLLRCKQQ